MERKGAVFILRLQSGRANAMDDSLLDAIERGIVEYEASDARAAVITGYERYFSAGLALPALVDLDRPAMKRFIERFSSVMARVHRCPRPVVAAINGHAIAGGCVLALQADFRVMADGEAKIGLNEVRLGIGLPAIALEPLRQVVPATSLVPIALEGELFSARHALELGLVEEVAPPDRLESRAIARAEALADIPASGFAMVKAALRRPVWEALERGGAVDTELWLDTWFSPAARTELRATAERLTRGRRRPSSDRGGER